jgi:triosephosphate isomerase
MEPLIVVNFKTYASAQGQAAVDLAKAMEAVDIGTNATLVAVVSAFDLDAVRNAAPKLQVWTQHLDPIGWGSNTGWLHPDTAIQRGAVGSIINHAEHKVDLQHVSELLKILPNDFPICACAADVNEAIDLAKLSPTFIAVEPPELIGGDVSVTTADPSIVSDTVSAVMSVNPSVRVLCGAGVKNGEDVAVALDLGAHGVLLASGVTKANNPILVLQDLVSSL